MYLLKRVFGIRRLLSQGVHTQKYPNTQRNIHIDTL